MRIRVRIGRVSKTINLEGYCSAVEIRTRVEKMESALAKAATSELRLATE